MSELPRMVGLATASTPFSSSAGMEDPGDGRAGALCDERAPGPGASSRDGSGIDGDAAALIGRDPADHASWLLLARLRADRGQAKEAQEACRRAIELWPDILPAYRLLSDLSGQAADADAAPEPLLDTAQRALLALQPGDAMLANRIASRLCARGRLAEALPYLRVAAPALGHQDSALWNYTMALAVTGGFHELLAIEPMLAEFARQVPPPFGPFAHLAAARLALHADRPAVLREAASLRASSRWLEATGLAERLAAAIAGRTPFSVVALSEPQARLVTHASLRAHTVLGEAEMSAVVNSVWRPAFGALVESHSAARAASFGRGLLSAIASADVIALPDAAHLAAAHEHFGFLAETQRIACQRPGAFTDLGAFGALHQTMPYLRPLLAGLPFLGFVGFYPDLAARLGRFARIAETVTYLVPAALDREDVAPELRGSGHFPEAVERTLAELAVPFPGALFLVAAGLPGTLYCGRIRELGGIALDIDGIITGWMRR